MFYLSAGDCLSIHRDIQDVDHFSFPIAVHVDPLATYAWNALVSGKKRWALFPPTELSGLVKSDLKPKGIGLDGESVTWFQKMYPKTKTFEWRSVQKKPPPLDVVQNAGEIMYVPDGWWHAVLNLTHTVAVTQVRPWAFPKIPTNTVCQYKTDTFFYLS